MKQEQVAKIKNYLEKNEKNKNDFLIGAEFEYFVVHKDTLQVVSYDGQDGVLSTLNALLNEKGYQGIFDSNQLMGLRKNKTTITLEPGCQLEISVKPEKELSTLEETYKQVCLDVISVLDKKNQALIATGYQVETLIDDVKMIPKERYHYMYDYFKSCDKYAHNMMKQTASTQVCIDYENETDYYQKYRILNTLSPVFYAFFDNSPFFEGNINTKKAIRSEIWNLCDQERCGIIKEAIENEFNYSSYAHYLLSRPVIFMDEKLTGDTQFKDLYQEKKHEDLLHAMSMVFPDVRTREFIEIRMFDSLPYPLNISVVAFIKGLFYDDNSLQELYQFVEKLTLEDVIEAKANINDLGMDTSLNGLSVYEIMKYLYHLAYNGLSEDEQKYLIPLANLLKAQKTPQQLTKERLNLGKHKALCWCILKEPLFWEDFKWTQAV